MSEYDDRALQSDVSDDRFSSKIDCWEEIYRFLNYKARAQCEVSCKCVAKFFENFWQCETYLDLGDVCPRIGTRFASSTTIGACSHIGSSLQTLRMSTAVQLLPTTFNRIIDNCPNIERIESLSPVEVIGVRFEALSKLKQIDFLLESNWTNENIRVLGRLPLTLEVLTGLRVDGIGRGEILLNECFPRYSMLKRFELEDRDTLFIDPHFQYSAFDVIADGCPLLEALTLLDCRNLRAAGVERLSNLKELKIGGTALHDEGQLSDEQMIEICSRNNRLQSLRIANRDWRLGERACQAIAALQALCELELSGWRYRPEQFTDAHLQTIISSPVGASLLRLSITWATHLSGASMDMLSYCCPNLRVLVIGCRALSAVSLRRLIDSVAQRSSRESFELYIGWRDEVTFATSVRCGEYAAIVASTALPAGVSVRRFQLDPLTLLAHTMVPVLVESAVVRPE